MNIESVKSLLNTYVDIPSKWELDNIIWAERLHNPKILIKFLKRIEELSNIETHSKETEKELENLLILLKDMDEKTCNEILLTSEIDAKIYFIENHARQSAIEVLTNNKISSETMTISCKLSPQDFIICAKRTQDIINSVHELVVKGETLSTDVAGA